MKVGALQLRQTWLCRMIEPGCPLREHEQYVFTLEVSPRLPRVGVGGVDGTTSKS